MSCRWGPNTTSAISCWNPSSNLLRAQALPITRSARAGDSGNVTANFQGSWVAKDPPIPARRISATSPFPIGIQSPDRHGQAGSPSNLARPTRTASLQHDSPPRVATCRLHGSSGIVFSSLLSGFAVRDTPRIPQTANPLFPEDLSPGSKGTSPSGLYVSRSLRERVRQCGGDPGFSPSRGPLELG